jgi:hypothetical protein
MVSGTALFYLPCSSRSSGGLLLLPLGINVRLHLCSIRRTPLFKLSCFFLLLLLSVFLLFGLLRQPPYSLHVKGSRGSCRHRRCFLLSLMTCCGLPCRVVQSSNGRLEIHGTTTN